MGRGGEKLLRWLTLMLGPVIVAEALLPGNHDEGLEMPALLEQAGGRVRELVGRYGRVLALLDAAFFERQVVEPLGQLKWDFIIGANQQRQCLTRLAEALPTCVWSASGADARRGWAESQVCCFSHLPAGWDAPVTIVARRWRFADELPGLCRTLRVRLRVCGDAAGANGPAAGVAEKARLLFGDLDALRRQAGGEPRSHREPLQDALA